MPGVYGFSSIKSRKAPEDKYANISTMLTWGKGAGFSKFILPPTSFSNMFIENMVCYDAGGTSFLFCFFLLCFYEHNKYLYLNEEWVHF